MSPGQNLVVKLKISIIILSDVCDFWALFVSNLSSILWTFVTSFVIKRTFFQLWVWPTTTAIISYGSHHCHQHHHHRHRRRRHHKISICIHISAIIRVANITWFRRIVGSTGNSIKISGNVKLFQLNLHFLFSSICGVFFLCSV